MKPRNNRQNRARNVIVSGDQFLNCCGGGNVDTTISGRTWVNHKDGGSWYWSLMLKMIDTCFRCMDGPDHCKQAYENDKGEDYFDANFIDRLFLFGVSFLGCAVMVLIANPIIFIVRKAKGGKK